MLDTLQPDSRAVHIHYVGATTPSDIFVSYARESTDLVESLLAALPTESVRFARDLAVFRDVQSLRTGELWDQALIEAVLKTRVMLSFISSAYVRSPMCMFELILFMNRGLVERVILDSSGTELSRRSPAIPLRTEECTMPIYLARLHAPMVTSASVRDPEFLQSIRSQIVDTVEDVSTVTTCYAGDLSDLRIDFENQGRDVGPLADPDTMRSTVEEALRRCRYLLRESSNAEEKAAVREIVEKTRAFLRSG